MPVKPTDAMHWYYRVFKAEAETVELLYNNPKDWTRLQIWDGMLLKPAMPEGFSGIPSEEQINMLYSHVQKNQLFFFKLGDPEPQLLTADGPVPIPKEPKEPVAPPPFEVEEPTNKQRIDYKESVRKYQVLLQQYHTAQDMHRDNPILQPAVDGYNASRNLEQDNMELQSRDESSFLQEMKNSREKAERVITQMMAPRPSAPPDVFYLDEQHSNHATMTYQQFDEYFEPNGYDLPENSKVDDYDAATINFAMMGVTSETEKIFFDKGDVGPLTAKSDARDGFHFMVTGLFGETRIKQPITSVMGDIMKMGQAAIEAYNKGDPTLLGQRLGETVRNINQFFTGTGQYTVTESLTAASRLTERLLDLFERKPDIWEASGLTEQDRDFMRGYVQIGKLYDKYADSQIKFNDAFFKGTPLSPEENAEILADAVIRKMVESELQKDSEAAESKQEFEDGQMEAMAKDQIAQQNLDAWIAENRSKFENKADFDAATEKQTRILDCMANSVMHSSLPCEHPIITKLAQPGMLERLRQNLMKDPAILEQASKSPMDFKPKELQNSQKLGVLAEQALDLSEKLAWFDNIKSMLTQNDPNAWLDPAVASDSNRLMITQGNGSRKKLVSVASLLEDGLQALQDPDKATIDLLYENAKNGNLYFYSKDKDMPTRLSTDGMQPSVQQLEPVQLPTRWQRFWNTVTFGLAYAKECNLPDRDPAAYELIVRARGNHAVPVRNEVEADQQEAVTDQQEQPQQEQIQQVEIKPWKYQALDTRNMSNDDFLAHVEATAMRGSEFNTENVLASENVTPEAYFEVITQQLEVQVARNIRDSLSVRFGEKRNQLLEAHKQNYTAMVAGLGEYVFNHANKEALAAYCSHPEEYSNTYYALSESADEIVRTGIFNYTTQLRRENAANEQAKLQEQPNNEVKLEKEEPQKQKEINPFVKG